MEMEDFMQHMQMFMVEERKRMAEERARLDLYQNGAVFEVHSSELGKLYAVRAFSLRVAVGKMEGEIASLGTVSPPSEEGRGCLSPLGGPMMSTGDLDAYRKEGRIEALKMRIAQTKQHAGLCAFLAAHVIEGAVYRLGAHDLAPLFPEET